MIEDAKFKADPKGTRMFLTFENGYYLEKSPEFISNCKMKPNSCVTNSIPTKVLMGKIPCMIKHFINNKENESCGKAEQDDKLFYLRLKIESFTQLQNQSK